jgi:hypothetical protein
VPVEVGQFTTEVTVTDGEMPLTPSQIEALVRLVLRRVEERQREQQLAREATTVRRQATPRPRLG